MFRKCALGMSRSVCSPLDRADVDPVLEHVPQRRQFTQLANFALEQVDGKINFFFGRKRPIEKRIELCASSSLRPRARSTYDGSRLAEVQAEPDDTAMSLIAMISDSPST